MAESDDDPSGESGLNEKLLDAFVFVPTGLALSVIEELPRLAARGRERLGVRVSSARAVGHFAVKAGHDEFVRRSDRWFHRPGSRPTGPGGRPAPADVDGRSAAAPTAATGRPNDSPVAGPHHSAAAINGHIPSVATLSIPGFDALSASQVVQRLDGLNRSELVSVRAYEASTRGRRTILSRVDQLLDERS